MNNDSTSLKLFYVMGIATLAVAVLIIAFIVAAQWMLLPFVMIALLAATVGVMVVILRTLDDGEDR